MQTKVDKKLFLTAFILYLVVFVWGIVFKLGTHSFGAEEFWQNWNTPLNERLYIAFNLWRDCFANFPSIPVIYTCEIFLNMVAFAPIGIFLPLWFSKTKTCVIVVLLAFFVEAIQLFVGLGGCDVVDFLANAIGGVVGVLLFAKFMPKIDPAFAENFCLSFILFAIPFCPIALFSSLFTFI